MSYLLNYLRNFPYSVISSPASSPPPSSPPIDTPSPRKRRMIAESSPSGDEVTPKGRLRAGYALLV